MELPSILVTGHTSACPSPDQPCTCEATLYITTGTLAFVAGLMQWFVGFRYSMAAVSDALHALSDSFADFLGVGIAKASKRRPLRAEQLRTIGNRLIALLLAAGAIIIAYEAYARWTHDTYLVWLPAVLGIGIFGLGIDVLRFRMLSQAGKRTGNTSTRALMEHAKSDAWHSAIICVIAILGIGGSFFHTDTDAYQYMVHAVDYAASLGLAGYMLAVLAPRIWRGQSCGHKHEPAKHTHSHDECCGHHHDHHHH